MKSDYRVILDACVLLPMPLVDTLLRMAETPRLYLPMWSGETLAEIARNLGEKWGKTPQQVQRRIDVMHQHFPESCVEGYEDLLGAMKNDPKDRHVLAAAVKCHAKLIVTNNEKHFPKDALSIYGIEVQDPSEFLVDLYDLEPGIVAQKVTEQAQNLGRPLEELLQTLRVCVPGFVTFFCEEQKIDLG